ncbi:hypothetical protein RUND412_004361 [Rhizina undulata]
MPLDSLSYTAPSRIRALLVPLGRIKRSRFLSFVERLQSSNVVRLGDVTPDTKPNRTMFSPQGFPGGQIVYDLTTSYDREHEYLENFEPHRRIYLVIAIADYAENNDSETLSQQLEELKVLYPRALYHTCLVFDSPPVGPSPCASPNAKRPDDDRPTFIPVPTRRQSRVTSMRTLMCDITSIVLSELTGLAKTLQALPTIESPLEGRLSGGGRDYRMSLPASAAGSGMGLGGGMSNVSKRMTMSGFGSGSGTERERNKGKTRVDIVVAGLYLLAGRVPDALKEFVESANSAKANNDFLWHGKALEGIGICLVVMAQLKVDFQIPMIPYPAVETAKPAKPSTPIGFFSTDSTPSSPRQLLEVLPELLTSILHLYSQSGNFADEALPQISYSETVLRLAKFQTSIYQAGGINDDSLANIVLGIPIPANGPKKNIPPRVEISETVMKAWPVSIERLTVLDATRILSGIASIFAAIGLRRRKALVTRELVKILIPGLIQARVVGAAEVGVHPAAGLSAISSGLGGSPLDLGEGDVETGVIELLEDLCRAYGILPALKSEEAGKSEITADSETLWKTLATAEIIAEQDIRSFGWSALKIHVLRNCMALCEALPDFQGVLRFTTQLLRTADGELTREEQMRLSTTISRTVGAARKLGLVNVEAEYWDQFLLRDVELIENTMWRPPVPHSKNELTDEDHNEDVPAAPIEDKTPFIYNPFLKKAETAASEPLMVKGETAEFRVTLQNPFEFDIEVESVRLDASGVDVDVQPVGTIINPYRTCQISVYTTPKKPGAITINGCRIKVFGCRERTFPIFTEGLDRRERDIKIKLYGLRATEPKPERPASTISASGRLSGKIPPPLHPIPKTLGLTIVDAQPLLLVKQTSLSQSAVMVLEGERKVFDITLRNISETEVDFLVFSFTDSTTGRIQAALAEKGNSPAEMFELELMLAKKRAFMWKKGKTPEKDGKSMFCEPRGEARFQIEVLGKPGLTWGNIQVDYGRLGVKRSEVERFYTRQVIYPVTVTVNASIELARVDFVPFGSSVVVTESETPETKQEQFSETFQKLAKRDKPGDYCLMLLDLRNAWPQPLRIKLSSRDPTGEDETFEASDILQAGHTSRIILPVKRIFLSNPTTAIPSLSASQRQFVVSSTKITAEQERQTRESFWYREEILKNLTGHWEELGSSRHGEIELRGIRLNPRMVETVRIEEVGIDLSVVTLEGQAVRRDIGGRYILPTTTFQKLLVTVSNRSSRAIRPLLRILPALRNHPVTSALELSRRFAWNGCLQQGMGGIGPGATREVEVGFVVLARGEYEVSASIEEVRDGEGEQMVGLDGMPVDVVGRCIGRRCWVGREGVGIVARDVE